MESALNAEADIVGRLRPSDGHPGNAVLNHSANRTPASDLPVEPGGTVSPGGGKPQAEVFEEASALDLDRQPPTRPEDGFGHRWRKVHRIPLVGSDVAPTQLISTWKEHFGEFWPGDNRFYGAITDLEPGELAVISVEMPGDTTLSTGVILADSSDDSFTLVTPKGHMLAAWLTFSAYREAATTIAQVEIVMRASDPLFEIGMVLVGHRRENRFWEETLRNLAVRFGVHANPETRLTREEAHYLWANATNVLHNSAIRNGLIRLASLPRKAAGRLRQYQANNAA
jgi:hypothetical protein